MKNMFIKSVKSADLFTIKLLQWISEKSFLPTRIINLLSTLKYNFPYHDIHHTKTILKRHKILNIFSEELIPISSGSVAQIYKTKIHNIANTVAVKILHPIKKNNILNYIPNRLKKLINFEEFITQINNQCNMKIEAENAIKLRNIFKNSCIIIPEVYYATDDLIIYNYEYSIHYKNYFESKYITLADKINIFSLVRTFIIKTIKEISLFHSDFHSYNWGVRDNKIVIYDFGYMSEMTWDSYRKLMTCCAFNDMYALIYYIISKCDLNYIQNIDNIGLLIKNIEVKIHNNEKINLKILWTIINHLIKTHNGLIDNNLLNILQIELMINDIYFTYLNKYIEYSDVLLHYNTITNDQVINDIYTSIIEKNNKNIKSNYSPYELAISTLCYINGKDYDNIKLKDMTFSKLIKIMYIIDA